MRYKTFRNLVALGVIGVIGGVAYLGVRRCSAGSDEDPIAARTSPDPATTPPAQPVTPAAAPARGDPDATNRGPGPAEAAPAEGSQLRPFDAEVLAMRERVLSGDKVKDALPGRPFKVNLYQDAGHARVNRLKLDLDRDGKWDEKWTFEDEGGRAEVKRQVAPGDDEKYSEEYRLRAGRWVTKR